MDKNDVRKNFKENIILSTAYKGKCGNCHSWLGDGAYCRYCGTKKGEGKFEPYENIANPIYGSPSTRKYECIKCGTKYVEENAMGKLAEYCHKCGAKVSCEIVDENLLRRVRFEGENLSCKIDDLNSLTLIKNVHEDVEGLIDVPDDDYFTKDEIEIPDEVVAEVVKLMSEKEKEAERKEAERKEKLQRLSTDYEGKCGNCHSWLGEDVYCRYCGTKKGEGKFEPYENIVYCLYGSPSTRKYKCRKCGTKYVEENTMGNLAEYCHKCGGTLDVKIINSFSREHNNKQKKNKEKFLLSEFIRRNREDLICLLIFLIAILVYVLVDNCR